MQTYWKLAKVVFLSLLGGVLGAMFLDVRPAHAQSAVSTYTLPIAYFVAAKGTELTEDIFFVGPILVTTTVVPAYNGSAASSIVQIDATGVKGIGLKTWTLYANSCQAILTRPFWATDVINTTYAFFHDTAEGFRTAETALWTLNLTYNTKTYALTKVTATSKYY